MKAPSRKSPATQGRVNARRCAVQAVYQWEITAHDPRDIYNEFVADREVRNVDLGYFRGLLLGVAGSAAALDERIRPLLDRPLNELDPIEHAVLLLGTYELEHCPEVPWRVVINEAVELSKMFGAEQAHRYINGILDKAARELRPRETACAS